MQEIRHLVFAPGEVQEMTLLLLEQRGGRPNMVSPVWQLGTEDPPRVSLSFGEVRAATRRLIALEASDLLSAAIIFCKRHHVMLPVRGQKRMTLMQGSLALVVVMRIGD